MIFNPPLKVNNVEVTSVNEQTHSIHFLVHIKGSIADLATMEVSAEVHRQVTNAVNYLCREGYIKDHPQNWLTHVGVICNNHNNN